MAYAPVDIEICLHAGEDVTIGIVKHSKQNDPILFNRVFECLIDSLQSYGLKVTTGSEGLARPGVIDDDFSFDDDEETSTGDDLWSERVELVQADIDSPHAAFREEALQHLARWAGAEPASHEAVARGIAKSKIATQLFTSPSASLAEMYPAAAALRNVVSSAQTEICESLCASPLFEVLTNLKVKQLPPVVASELTLAIDGLKLWSQYSKEFGCGVAPIIGSNASTCCPDLGSNNEFADNDFGDDDTEYDEDVDEE
jgi:hypothetical protein